MGIGASPGGGWKSLYYGEFALIMVQEAALGIAVIGREGAVQETVCNADVVVTEITDAPDFILKPLRHQATLRR